MNTHHRRHAAGLLLAAESLASLDSAVRVTVPAGKPRIVDASTAHRIDPDWVFGFPELAPEMRERNRAIHTMCRSFEPVMYEVASVY